TDRTPETAAGKVPPRTPTERAVAEVWCQVLGIAGVGAFDRFADLGGHSLLGIQVLWRLQEQFAVELPLRAVLEAGTLADLAAMVDAAVAGGAEPGAAAAIRPLSREPEVPLSFTQRRLWFLNELAPGNP